MTQVSKAINVSNVGRKNFVLRTAMDPHDCYVIPNAVDCTKFKPDPSKIWPKDKINVVVVSRHTTPKGVDLLLDMVPYLCNKYPNIHFIIVGDGNKHY
jgi:phosphatidylinositol glycan class A protein